MQKLTPLPPELPYCSPWLSSERKTLLLGLPHPRCLQDVLLLAHACSTNRVWEPQSNSLTKAKQTCTGKLQISKSVDQLVPLTHAPNTTPLPGVGSFEGFPEFARFGLFCRCSNTGYYPFLVTPSRPFAFCTLDTPLIVWLPSGCIAAISSMSCP